MADACAESTVANSTVANSTALAESTVVSVMQKRMLVEPHHPKISILRQCELLGLPRSSFYYQPAGESPLNEQLMRLIDEEYTRHPFYGVPRMTDWLRDQGFVVNPKRIARLMRKMDLQAIQPKRRTTQPDQQSRKYPCLLRHRLIEKPNEVWASDITYVRLRRGFVYLVAIMDWYSRYVVAWELSNSLDAFFCQMALQRALMRARPAIFHSDQGSQYTSTLMTDCLSEHGIAISMSGSGRVWDNIFIERLWRSVKWEEVYLHEYETVCDVYEGLSRYFAFYNSERRHSALNRQTPEQVYLSFC